MPLQASNLMCCIRALASVFCEEMFGRRNAYLDELYVSSEPEASDTSGMS